MKTTARNPDGLETKKPIALRLMPEELEEAERISKLIGYSKSFLAREAYLKGLPIICREAGIAHPVSHESKE
ncbi:MAG TPA: hypothetical protein VJ576_09630 [Rhodocyclaceae bacterium]|nr:hypothetical protein [Rhodocyclaceae bacterium]